jgi:hypothetical protein
MNCAKQAADLEEEWNERLKRLQEAQAGGAGVCRKRRRPGAGKSAQTIRREASRSLGKEQKHTRPSTQGVRPRD